MNYQQNLRKDRQNLINKFSILNVGRYISSVIFQNNLVFIPAKK